MRSVFLICVRACLFAFTAMHIQKEKDNKSPSIEIYEKKEPQLMSDPDKIDCCKTRKLDTQISSFFSVTVLKTVLRINL